ncbi:hypothetical protein SAMN05192588_1462 [Nonlabens sp. Hel1_33_55]|nr:hypothetical protein SAMN05192588_1462 [Nonlabens sp. Hel1_33_55]
MEVQEILDEFAFAKAKLPTNIATLNNYPND